MSWAPKLSEGLQVTDLTLTAQEGFVVSRIDGKTTVHELSQLTGMNDGQVMQLLERLESEGAIEHRPEAEAEAHAGEQPESSASFYALYREKFHALPGAQREQLATTANGADLSALCFDPLPQVIRNVLANPLCGPEQARLIAAHHASSTGLEFLLGRADLSHDAEVQRLLWRNPQLSEGQLRRLTQSKRLHDIWRLSVSREATAQTRAGIMKVLRARFPAASGEERVDLIFKTEGRALAGLTGLPIDGRTTALLCARTYSSVMLIQNIAHWGAAPPALIAHLLKQPLVRRQTQLRKALENHPNAPSGGHH